MNPPQGDVQIDPSVDPISVANDDDEDATAIFPSRASPSLHSTLEKVLETQSSHHTMMETFLTTQVAHG